MDYIYVFVAVLIAAVILLTVVVTAKYLIRVYLLGVTEVGTMMIRPKAVKDIILHVTSQFHEIIKVKSKITSTKQGLKLHVSISLNQVVGEDYLRELQTEIHNVLQNMGVEVYGINISILAVHPKKIR